MKSPSGRTVGFNPDEKCTDEGEKKRFTQRPEQDTLIKESNLTAFKDEIVSFQG